MCLLQFIYYGCSLAMLAASRLQFRSLFAAEFPRSIGWSSPNFATCLTVTQIYKIRSEIWVAPSPEIWQPKKHQNFSVILHNFCGTQQDIVNWNTALQTLDTLTHANLTRFTLVHKWRKIGSEFWLTQWAAIRLGIATHLVFITVYYDWLTQDHPVLYTQWAHFNAIVWITCNPMHITKSHANALQVLPYHMSSIHSYVGLPCFHLLWFICLQTVCFDILYC